MNAGLPAPGLYGWPGRTAADAKVPVDLVVQVPRRGESRHRMFLAYNMSSKGIKYLILARGTRPGEPHGHATEERSDG